MLLFSLIIYFIVYCLFILFRDDSDVVEKQKAKVVLESEKKKRLKEDAADTRVMATNLRVRYVSFLEFALDLFILSISLSLLHCFVDA
jgi:hypothetical protein